MPPPPLTDGSIPKFNAAEQRLEDAPTESGWTTGSGTQNKGAFNADATVNLGAVFTTLGIATDLNSLIALVLASRQRILALEAVLRARKLIN